MKKYICLILLLSTLSVFADDRFKILVQLPLSGPLAATGDAIRSGVEMAYLESPIKDRVKLIFDDNQYQATLAINSLKNHQLQSEVDAMIIFGGPTSLAIRSLVMKDKIPTIALSAATQLDSENNGYILRIWESADAIAEAINQAIIKEKSKRIAIISTENEACLAIRDSLKKLLPDGFIFDEQVALADNDFRSMAVKLKSAKPDMIVSNLLSSQHTALISRIREINLLSKIVANSAIFFDSKVREPFAPILNDVYIGTVDDSKAANLYEQLKLKGQAANAVYMTALGYDAVGFFFNSFAAGWDPKSAPEIKNANGLLGSYTRKNQFAYNPPMALMRFEASKLIQSPE